MGHPSTVKVHPCEVVQAAVGAGGDSRALDRSISFGLQGALIARYDDCELNLRAPMTVKNGLLLFG